MQGGPGFQSDGSVRDIIQASGDVRGFENSKFLRIFLQVAFLPLSLQLCIQENTRLGTAVMSCARLSDAGVRCSHLQNVGARMNDAIVVCLQRAYLPPGRQGLFPLAEAGDLPDMEPSEQARFMDRVDDAYKTSCATLVSDGGPDGRLLSACRSSQCPGIGLKATSTPGHRPSSRKVRLLAAFVHRHAQHHGGWGGCHHAGSAAVHSGVCKAHLQSL